MKKHQINSNSGNRKRKLKYDDLKQPGQGWGKLGDGFSNFIPTQERIDKLPKQQSEAKFLSRGKPIVASFPEFSEEGEDEEVDEDISWNSSSSCEDTQEDLRNTSLIRKTVKRRSSRKNTGHKLDIDDWDDAETYSKNVSADGTEEKIVGQSKEQVIQGYDSDDDSNSEAGREPDANHTNPSSASPSISGTSSPASLCSQSETGKVKASDWVRNLKLITPQKRAGTPEHQAGDEDSAKKRKSKYIRGGLADQLNKLQVREKSDVRMWRHQQTTTVQTGSQDNPKAFTVRVIGLESLFSLTLARCKVLTEPKDGGHSLTILFSEAVISDIAVEIGTVLQVCPPWQELELKMIKGPVLLCANYCQVLSTEKSDNDLPVKDESDSVTAKWNCPCSSGLCGEASRCPAYLYPCLPAVRADLTLKSAERRDSSSAIRQDGESMLHTVSSAWLPRNMSDCLLDSVERAGSGQCSTVCFKGLVHRVVQRNSESLSMIVEDGHGTVCEIRVLEQNEQHGDLTILEGRSLLFSGLHVQTRINRDREPNLFSLIDVVWSGTKARVTSQSTEDSQTDQDKMTRSQPPSFCYILCADRLSLEQLLQQELPYPVCPFRQAALCSLSELLKTSETIPGSRVTFMGKVIYHSSVKDTSGNELNTSKNNDSVFKSRLYVTDPSLKDKNALETYLIVNMKHECFVEKLSSVLKKKIIVFRDIIAEKGTCYADGYSSCFPIQDKTQDTIPWLEGTLFTLEDFQNLELKIPHLVVESSTNSLVSISGRVTGVDEDLAYSWEVCDKCGGEDLKSLPSNRNLVCVDCGQAVIDPITKLKMEVFVRCPSIDHNKWKVRTDLLEETIQKLLSVEDRTNEGYELTNILNKMFGPLNCILLARRNQEFYLKEISIQ